MHEFTESTVTKHNILTLYGECSIITVGVVQPGHTRLKNSNSALNPAAVVLNSCWKSEKEIPQSSVEGLIGYGSAR